MDKLMKYGGIALMLIGIFLVLSGVPAIPKMSIVSIGPISADVPQFIATRIIIGAVVAFMGFKAYEKGKKA